MFKTFFLKLALGAAIVSLAPVASSATNISAGSGYQPLFLGSQPDCLGVDTNGAVAPNTAARVCDSFGGMFTWTVPVPVTATTNFSRTFKVYGQALDHDPPFLSTCNARSLKLDGTTRAVSPSVILPLTAGWVTLGAISVQPNSGDTTDVQCGLLRGSWIRTVQH